jgi:hypothetical protein
MNCSSLRLDTRRAFIAYGQQRQNSSRRLVRKAAQPITIGNDDIHFPEKRI